MSQALRLKQYNVTVYRPNYNEAKAVNVKKGQEEEFERGWACVFPRSLLGFFKLFCAYTRLFLCTLSLVFDHDSKFDFIIVDQTSFHIPILRAKCSRIIFYCNNPHILQHQTRSFFGCTGESSIFIRIILWVLGLCTEFTLGMAHRVIVNSMATQRKPWWR